MAQNIQSLQLLRNSVLFNRKAEAVSGLTSGATQDGVIKLARYQEDGKIKTIFGIYHATSDGSGYTIYDGDSEVIKALEDAIKTLSGDGTGSIAEQIQKAIDGLKGSASPSADTLGELEGLINKEVADRKAAITQAGKDASGYTDSKIGDLNATVTGTGAAMNVVVAQAAGEITAVTVNDSNVATTGAVNTAKSDAINSAKAYTDNQINGLDFTGITANQVVTNITQTDGKITSTGESLGGVQLGAYTANTGATGEIASTDTLAAALNKITNKINTEAAAHDIKSSGKTINVTASTTGTNIDVNIKDGEHVLKSDGNAGLYTDIELKKITTGLSANVQEEYQLVGSDGTALGDPVQIYKDSALLSVALLHASGETLPTYDGTWHDISATSEANLALCYAYSNVSGETEVVAVPVGSFLRESEFKDGLQVVGGKVSVKKDGSSELFLEITKDGVKVSGIQSAIDKAKGEAQTSATTYTNNKLAELTDTTTGTGSATNMTVAVTQKNGKITAVTVNDSDVASKIAANTTAIQQNKLTNASDGAIILGKPDQSGTSIKLGTLDAGTY